MHIRSLKLSFPHDRYFEAARISYCGSRKSFTFYLLLGDINGSRFRFRLKKNLFQNTSENTFWLTLCRFFGTSYMREKAEAAIGSWRNAREENIKGPKEATFQASRKTRIRNLEATPRS